MNPTPRSLVRALAACSLLVAASGCLTPTVPMEVERPRRFAATSRLRTLVMVPIEGRYAARTEKALADMLDDTEVRGKRFWTLVEQRRVDNARAELGRLRSGRASRGDLDSIRLKTGALGVLSGRITEANVRDSNYREMRARCVEQENTWRGVILRKCEEGMEEQVEVSCTKREVRFTFEPQMLSLETGKVAFADRYSRGATSTHCQGERGSVEHPDDLFDELIEQVMIDIRRDIRPNFDVVKVPIKEIDEGDASEEQIAEFKSAIEFAKAERLDRSCEIWNKLRREGLDGLPLRYNLAICQEYAGDLEGTLTMLEKTDRTLARPDEHVNLYLRRVREQIAESERLAKIYRDSKSGQQAAAPKRSAPKRRVARPDADVRNVQARLNSLGYDCGPADGMMGPKTHDCLAQYQRRYGLQVTSTVTPEVLSKLGFGRGSSSPARASD